jgi:guanylate kinase
MASDALRQGKLIVLSGPSGSGKSTLVQMALAPGDLPVRLAVSATTRTPRPGEVDGVHYHFWTRHRFQQAIAAGEFLEWANVYGELYGTLVKEVDPYLQQGICVLLEIDVQGARQIRARRPDCVTVFLRASSLEEYERRLRARGTEDPASLRSRLQAAEKELAHAAEFDVELINDHLETAVQEFRDLLRRLGGS